MKAKSLVVFMVIVSCSSFRESPESDGIFIDLNKTVSQSVNNVFERVELIPLETNDKSTLAEIKKVVFHNGHYYILDFQKNAIVIFDEKGKFSRRFERIGKGPGEYLGIDDFEINPFTGNLELMQVDGRLMTYSITGDFLTALSLGKVINSTQFFTSISDDIVVFFSEYSKKRLTYYSRKENKILFQEHDVPSFVSRVTPMTPLSSPFYRYNGKVNFFEPHSNNVYKLNHEGAELKYKWDFGQHNFTIDLFPKGQDSKQNANFWMESTKDYASFFRYNMENDDLIIKSYAYDKSYNLLIYNKVNSSYQIIKRFEEGAIPILVDFVEKEPGVYSCLSAHDIRHYINSSALNPLNQKIFNNISETDNPVIFKYHFK